MEKVVECTDLEKKYFLFDKDYKIIPWLFTKKGCEKEIIPLTNINLTINKGDVIGFIGKNGAGKSTLMKIIAGITMNTSGGLEVKGKVNSLINLSAGFNPKYTGRQNIYYKGLLMGMNKHKVDEIIDEIIDFCELGDFFDLPLYMYSSGMSARLGFALAVFAEHDILIVDEVFAVGDKAFRRKSEAKMRELFTSGKSIIFASHSDDQIREFCNRAIFIDESKIVVDGTVEEALLAYNKKYAPQNMVQEKSTQETENSESENKYKSIDRFMNIVNSKIKLEKADLYRELAIFHENEGSIEMAYKYMLYAKKLRPDGPFILEKIQEYNVILGDDIVKEYNDMYFELNKIDGFLNYMNNNIYIEKADIYREIAVFHELHEEYDMAYTYMAIAKELRPNGEYIISKYNQYKYKS